MRKKRARKTISALLFVLSLSWQIIVCFQREIGQRTGGDRPLLSVVVRLIPLIPFGLQRTCPSGMVRHQLVQVVQVR